MALWHRVNLRNAAKYDKITLLRELVQRSSVKFVPICYSTSGPNSFFYVEDAEAARALKVNSSVFASLEASPDPKLFQWPKNV
jgi:hypothetical protein